ncbi:putative serine/threonine-protein kinase haspin [Dermatophagoides farinae]|uniref:non-specific serine/threonine protein kinase n=1 Tax=Dermatophagoides farinae TaxID=6954 RepID=A0A9D4P1U9_DERFA|nr:putative serine/threonine-protein kinase haspin [Dermatophagoides farinae]
MNNKRKNIIVHHHHHHHHQKRDDKSKKDYFRLIINFILDEDKFRSKLLNLSIPKISVGYEQAFPKRSKFERFEYIGSGSYAQVYRHKIMDPSVAAKVVDGIGVFSEGIIKNLFGVKSSSSVSNYKHAYNEFRISISLSYLNIGVRYRKLGYQCPLFPNVHVVKKRIAPEVAAIRMEDCGQSLYDQMENYQPLEILSVTKQLLLGFMIAEKVFEFEHRDLHLGNILVKQSPYEQLTYVYDDQFIQMPSNNLLVKVIDTTFSRLKIKNRIHYRDLSHLFDPKDFEYCAGPNNQLAHQNETYKAMASEVQTDWLGFYPRTNMFWLIYIIRKFGRIMRKQYQQRQYTSDWYQVRSILKCYIHSLFKMNDLKTFYRKIMIRPQFNLIVPIRIMTMNDSNSNHHHHHNYSWWCSGSSSLSRCHTISTTSTIVGNVVKESNVNVREHNNDNDEMIDDRKKRQKSQSTSSPTISCHQHGHIHYHHDNNLQSTKSIQQEYVSDSTSNLQQRQK